MTITTRTGKGSALTHDEMDANLNAVNNWTYGPATKTIAKTLTPEDGVKIYPQGSDGGPFIGGTGKAAGYYDDDGVDVPNGIDAYGKRFKPTGGDGSAGWERDDKGALRLEWFGGIIGGVTDAAAAFQLAADALVSDPSVLGQPCIDITEGAWRIDTPPTLPDFEIKITCSNGIANLRVQNMVAASYALTIDKRGSSLSNLYITSDTRTVHGIKSENASWLNYRNVRVNGCGDAYTFENCHDSLAMDGITSFSCARDVVFSTLQSTSLRFTRFQFEKGVRCVDVLAPLSDVHFFQGGFATLSGIDGGRLFSCDGSSIVNSSITECRFENQSGTNAESLYLKGLDFTTWAELVIKNNHFTGGAGTVLNHITLDGNVGGLIDENTFRIEPTNADIANTATSNIEIEVGSNNKYVKTRATKHIILTDVGTTNYRKRNWRPIRITYDRIQLDCSATGYKTLAVALSTQTRWPGMELPNFVSGYELIHVANVGTALLKGQPEVELTTTTATFRYNVQTGAAGTDYVTFDLIVYGY